MYPIIHPIEPFDASIGSEIKFTWRGNQIYKVRCIVKNNESGTTVYDHTESTMKQSYTIPANSGLVNGVYYVVYITVLDVNNKESDQQDIGTPFYCFSKPSFSLSVADGGIIQTSAYKVGINYAQAQDEQLDSYSFTLYTYQKTVISSSGDIYNTSDMSYVISGLENAKQYYIRATGKTLHGITLDTGYILITVSYTIAQVFNTLELNNKPESGAIEIKSNIVSAIGLSEKDVIYIGDEYADLRDNSVTFDEGFEVRGDFTKIFVFYEPERNKSIISFGDGDRLKVDIYYRIGKYADSNGEKAYFELVANSCGVNYAMNSNYVDIPNPSYQQFALLVNRQGSYYDLMVVLISSVIRYSANADGSNMTESRQPDSQYVGVGYMPKEIYENPNLLGNSDFRNGVTDWYADKTNLTLVEGELQVKAQDTDNPYWRVYYNPSKNLFINNIEMNKFLYYYVEAKSPDLSGCFIGQAKQIVNNEWHFILGNNTNGYIKETRRLNDTTLSIQIERNKTVYIKRIIACKNLVDHWYPAPSDWLSDPNNYTWKPL